MRIFLAASIQRFPGTDDLLEEISAIRYSKPVRTPELHLTFRFFGDVTPGYVDELKVTVSRIPFQKFLLKIKGLGAFPSIEKANVLFLEVENSQQIEESAKLASLIEPVEKKLRPFVPHITVSRFNRPVDCTNIRKKYNSLEFQEEIHSLKIYMSTLTGKIPIYTQLKSIQLK